MINICFHGIGTPQRDLEPDEDHYWISVEFYEEILTELTGRGDVAISFDDGNASDLIHGLPGLLRHGRTASFFPLAARLDTPGSLGANDLVELRQAGMTIGSHGMDHVPWRYLDDVILRRELVDARDRLSEAAGAPIRDAALPLGRYDRKVLRALRRYRYERVYSSDRRRARPSSWLQPRFSVTKEDTLESFRRTVLVQPGLGRRFRNMGVGVVKRVR